MEGESNNKENSSKLASYEAEGTSNHDVSEEHHIQNQYFGRSGIEWNFLPKLPQNNYVEYLSESSCYLPNTATTAEYNMIGNSHYHTLGSSSSSFNDPGKADFGFKLIDSSSHDFGVRKVKLMNGRKKKLVFSNLCEVLKLMIFFLLCFVFSVQGFGEVMKERKKLINLKLEVVKISTMLRLVN